MTQTTTDRLVALRREFHRRPEPAWREFWTTCRVVEELERIGVDDLLVGREVHAGERNALPDGGELDAWLERAREDGADPDTLAEMSGGYTGAIAVLERGEGPTVGLRVDIDGLPRVESEADDHEPAREGFRSENEGAMHACGHDGHTVIGLGVLERLEQSDFEGTLKIFFQPAEEVTGGGATMTEAGHADDCDYLLAVHLGLDHPTGEVVAGIDGFLSVAHLEAAFRGEGAHAGAHPEEGRNAIQAAATAVQNLYGIPRNGDGATRINVGTIEGGTATNVVADEAELKGEVRGETTELMEYTREVADRVLRSAATMHDCEVEVVHGQATPSASSDPTVANVVADVAGGVDGVDTVLDSAPLGGSEDASFLMRRVQEGGGLAAYVGIGTDHPGGHHSPTFDIDEDSLAIGVETLASTIKHIATEEPEP